MHASTHRWIMLITNISSITLAPHFNFC
jgi:hypothetical protein